MSEQEKKEEVETFKKTEEITKKEKFNIKKKKKNKRTDNKAIKNYFLSFFLFCSSIFLIILSIVMIQGLTTSRNIVSLLFNKYFNLSPIEQTNKSKVINFPDNTIYNYYLDISKIKVKYRNGYLYIRGDVKILQYAPKNYQKFSYLSCLFSDSYYHFVISFLDKDYFPVVNIKLTRADFTTVVNDKGKKAYFYFIKKIPFLHSDLKYLQYCNITYNLNNSCVKKFK